MPANPASGTSDSTAGTDAVELKVTIAEKKELAGAVSRDSSSKPMASAIA
jgi:hypothetical protein